MRYLENILLAKILETVLLGVTTTISPLVWAPENRGGVAILELLLMEG